MHSLESQITYLIIDSVRASTQLVDIVSKEEATHRHIFDELCVDGGTEMVNSFWMTRQEGTLL